MVNFIRIIKFSFQDIKRNIWLSLVTVIILILALCIVNMLFTVKIIGNEAVQAVKQKVDINLYLKNTAKEGEIKNLQKKISNLSDVKEVDYVSRSEALVRFKEKYHNNIKIQESLQEVGKNPLSAHLIIKPKNLDNFDSLINHLNTIDNNIIESKNFSNYKIMLEKINSITEKVNKAGYFLMVIFLLIILLVVFNSVRIAIHNHRLEIRIMRLVGASNLFVQVPFILSGIIFTFLSTISALFIFYPFLGLVQPYLEAFFSNYNFNIISYFFSNIFYIFSLEFLGLSFIVIIASFLAVKKYSVV